MTQEQRHKNNQLIFDFDATTELGKDPIYRYKHGGEVWQLEGLSYHRSWRWLMPVFEQICRLKIGDGRTYIEYPCARTFGMLSRESGEILVRLDGFQLFKADTLLEATYLAVVDFIEWYNFKQAKDEKAN